MERRMNHWKPNGNFFVGDCMPFYKDGVFHLYYLLDVGHHNHPVVGCLGGHQFAHAVSDDLVHWKHEPIALSLDFENGECSNCTGSMLEYQNRLFAFYSLRSRSFPGEEFRIAVSDDGGRIFQKWELPDLKTPPESAGQFRDPKAFVGEDGLVHVLMSSGTVTGGTVPVRIGEVAHFTTSDLLHYRREAPFLRSWRIPECCDYFRWGDRYYYSYNSAWETHIRCSEKAFGSWEIPSNDVPASRYCCVMKTAPWKNGRRIGAGWVPTWENGSCLFGGRTVFRELVREHDGSLGTSFVREMIPNANETVLEPVPLEVKNGIALRDIGTFPDEFRLDGTVSFQAGTAEFGIVVMSEDQVFRRFVSFEPETRIVELDSNAQIRRVDMESGTVSFRLLRTKDVIDLEIDGRRTVVSPGYDFPGSLTVLYVRDGKASFRNLKVFTW